MQILDNDEHSKKSSLLISSIEFGIKTSFKCSQPRKTLPPIFVTEEGIAIFINDVQSEKA